MKVLGSIHARSYAPAHVRLGCVHMCVWLGISCQLMQFAIACRRMSPCLVQASPNTYTRSAQCHCSCHSALQIGAPTQFPCLSPVSSVSFSSTAGAPHKLSALPLHSPCSHGISSTQLRYCSAATKQLGRSSHQGMSEGVACVDSAVARSGFTHQPHPRGVARKQLPDQAAFTRHPRPPRPPPAT